MIMSESSITSCFLLLSRPRLALQYLPNYADFRPEPPKIKTGFLQRHKADQIAANPTLQWITSLTRDNLIPPAVKMIVRPSKRVCGIPFLFIIGGLLQLVFLGAFGYLLRTGYDTAINARFLSLVEGSGDCESILVMTSSTHLVDKNGNWDVSTTFMPEEALFEVTAPPSTDFSFFSGCGLIRVPLSLYIYFLLLLAR